MASFTSYTIGHNLGATVFTAGAIRFRIYSAWGLSIADVVKIAFVTGLTFWLGNAFVLGAGLLIVPDAASAITQLPPWINRAVALSGLAIIAGYLLWLLPRAAHHRSRRLAGHAAVRAADTRADRHRRAGSRPPARSRCTCCCPADPSIDFITVLVIFVTAALLGFLSHAPGSLGVFEAAMLVALPQFQKEELLASLLIFRVLYFMLPFCAAVLLLSVREGWLAARVSARKACATAAAAKERQLS